MGVFSNPGAELTAPESLTISHEKSRNGKISSVVYLDYGQLVDCDNTCQVTPESTTLRAQFKLSYDPVKYGTLIGDNIDEVITLLVAFLSDSANVAKFKNQEA